MPDVGRLVTARASLAVALAVAWLNFLLTIKWALLPGALNGWKRPWYGAALVAATVLTFVPWRTAGPVRLAGLRWLVTGACVLLGAAYIASFPPSTWQLVPFADDWVPRYQSTVDGINLLRRGAVAGWQWAFLGGYQTSADLTQSLTVLGALPMALAGERLGFHILHLILVCGIPFFIYVDIAADDAPSRARPTDLALLSAFFALICTVGMFGTIVPSGDTNSIAGVFTAMIAIVGSRMARLGKRWGGAVLVLGLTLAIYSHGAFFLYVVVFLLLEAIFYRDWRMACRSSTATAVAVAASLPQYIEMLRYPDFFIRNNLVYEETPIDPLAVAQQIFYNLEILLHPHRWFNDYLGLTAVFLALFVWMALRPGQRRPRFYAWMVLTAMALFRLNVVETGYLFARVMHMLAALAPVPLAWFVLEYTNDRRLAWALVALFALYPQASFDAIRHVDHVRDFDAALFDRVSGLDGHLVLLENSPHRDLDRDPAGRTERTPFPAHFEALLPAATGKRFYGQTWDTWHWTPFRRQVVAGGSFRGEAIGKTPVPEFVDEMRKWGVRHLVVWSQATRQYLDSDSGAFTPRWQNGRWAHYELAGADVRAVVAGTGEGKLTAADPLEAEVHLSRIARGSLVVLRANYFPAWSARAGGRDVPLFPSDGQMAFAAPADGEYVVRLSYPRRPWLVAIAVSTLIGGALLVSRICVIPSSPSAVA